MVNCIIAVLKQTDNRAGSPIILKQHSYINYQTTKKN